MKDLSPGAEIDYYRCMRRRHGATPIACLLPPLPPLLVSTMMVMLWRPSTFLAWASSNYSSSPKLFFQPTLQPTVTPTLPVLNRGHRSPAAFFSLDYYSRQMIKLCPAT